MEEAKKLDWLLARLPAFVDAGETLVFANQIAKVEEVAEKVKAAGFRYLQLPPRKCQGYCLKSSHGHQDRLLKLHSTPAKALRHVGLGISKAARVTLDEGSSLTGKRYAGSGYDIVAINA